LKKYKKLNNKKTSFGLFSRRGIGGIYTSSINNTFPDDDEDIFIESCDKLKNCLLTLLKILIMTDSKIIHTKTFDITKTNSITIQISNFK